MGPLRLGETSGQLSELIAVESRPSPGLATVQHHARLTGLDPNAGYFYRAAHDGGQSDDFSFDTVAPSTARSDRVVRFTAFGDQGTKARIPWMPVLGNHEVEATGSELGYESYFARFTPPATGLDHPAGATNWSLRIGNVGFVALLGAAWLGCPGP